MKQQITTFNKNKKYRERSELVTAPFAPSNTSVSEYVTCTRASARSAYTLVEMVVVIGVLVLISAVATDMFFNITRAYNKANAIAEIEQSGSTALNSMVNEIRQARSVTKTSTTTIEITRADDTPVTFGFRPATTSPDTNGCLYRGTTTQCLTDDTLTTGVNVLDVTFTVVDSDPQMVKIEMTISQPLGVPTRQDFRAQTTLKTSVVLRSYQ